MAEHCVDRKTRAPVVAQRTPQATLTICAPSSGKWILLALLVGTALAALTMFGVEFVAAGLDSGRTYYETFATTIYKDAAQTTAMWDTAAGQLRLHPPVPRVEGVAGQLYYPSAWSAAVYVTDTGRVYLFGGTGNPDAIQEYDPATNSSVKSGAVLPYELSGAGAFYVESRSAVYLVGGNWGTTDILVLDVNQRMITVLPNKLPTPLSYASAVYVPSQDKAYIFGGMAGSSPLDTRSTILEYDLAAGTVVTLPVSLPISPVAMTSAVYDPVTESAYIFGGQYFGVPTQRIVKFDVVRKTTPTVVGLLPVHCSGTSAVYVPEQEKAYIFGGQGAGATAPLSQTVQFDIASSTATTLTANLPLERSGATAIYIPSRATAYVLGGQSGLPTFPIPLSDIVAFDVNAHTATEIGTSVDGRSGASAIYAPSARKAYLFGGRSGYSNAASQSILVYDVDRVMIDVLPATLPVSRTDTTAVYVPATNQAYVFGGLQPGPETDRYFADILRFDVATERAITASAVLPTGRAGVSAVYVPGSGKAYLFGGVGDSGCLDQILAYDPVQDRLTILSSTLPTAVAYAAVAYDAATDAVYLFGGWNPNVTGQYLDQIVAFDVGSETATPLLARLPFMRGRAAAIAIPGQGVAYVIGGTYGPGRHLGDVVRFDAATGVVTSVSGLRLDVPRSSEAAVYVPEKVMAYLFGGTGYSGDQPLSDIVTLKFAYSLSETAQSLRVNEVGEEVHQALLTAQQTLRGGSVSYLLSNDGGHTWASVLPGVRHVFASPGSDLRWRAVLSGNGETNPVVDSLTITYNEIEQYQLFLPVILKGHGAVVQVW
jgi:N-acetylneuraminic acid mutarotase